MIWFDKKENHNSWIKETKRTKQCEMKYYPRDLQVWRKTWSTKRKTHEHMVSSIIRISNPVPRGQSKTNWDVLQSTEIVCCNVLNPCFKEHWENFLVNRKTNEGKKWVTGLIMTAYNGFIFFSFVPIDQSFVWLRRHLGIKVKKTGKHQTGSTKARRNKNWCLRWRRLKRIPNEDFVNWLVQRFFVAHLTTQHS